MLIMVVVDVLATGGFVFWYLKPDASVSIYLIFAVPILCMVNFIIAGIVYFTRRYLTTFFVLNAFISPAIFVFWFQFYIDKGLDRNIESWNFTIDGVGYGISYTPSFADTYDVQEYDEAGSWGHDRGTVKRQNDTIYFFSVDSTRYYIHKNYLYGFRGIEKIEVKKVH